MINNLIKIQESKIEMYRQLHRTEPQISETALINRMEIKDEQMLQKLKRFSALLCATCDEIGMPDKPAIEINFGPAVDDE